MKTQITKLEVEFLLKVKQNCFSTDGNGLHGPFEFTNPKIERGVLSSLVKKGIVGVEVEEEEEMFTGEVIKTTWVWVKDEYQEETNEEKYSETGYKFRNLEF